jgi:molybdopterin biosynthesis enzyme
MQSVSRYTARLIGSVKGGGDRPVYHPCRLELSDGRLFVEALQWGGSADLLGLSHANGLLVVPKNCGNYQEGDVVEVIPLVSRFRHESE